MTALILGGATLTSLGDGAATFTALLAGDAGPVPLAHGDPGRLRVTRGHHVPDGDPNTPFRASGWLTRCVREALDASAVDPARARVACVVGSGLRELAAVELLDPRAVPVHRLHFADAVRRAAPEIGEVVTVSNACSAGGHALALAQDMVELGDADAVVVAAADAMTESMLAMIGRVADEPTDRVRPFDAGRTGVLLGEGAAAFVIVAEGSHRPDQRGAALARVLATGLSCDAHHETAPSAEGIGRAMRDAYHRAGRRPRETGLVLAHGTGTALNDPTECAALRDVLVADGGDPLITGVKGAVGHTSGVAALTSLDVALRCLRTGRVPPITGLRTPLPEGKDLRLLIGVPAPTPGGLVQLDAFGFGGVNAVTLLERP